MSFQNGAEECCGGKVNSPIYFSLQCEHEIEIMMVLQHPKLLQLYDAFATGNNMVMILE